MHLQSFFKPTLSRVMLFTPLTFGCAARATSPQTHAPSRGERPALRLASADAAEAEAGIPPGHFAALVERARRASREPAPAARVVALPPSLRDVDWSTYSTIRYLPERSLWRGQPGHFEAQFFHLGFIYRTPVALFVVDGQHIEELPFERERFSYGALPPPAADLALGYAGLRLHTNLNSADYRDELVVFQGASYFRAVGRGNALGLSARALAIDTGESSAEEFPRFTELYLLRPAAEARSVWVLGLLESKRATGACAFRIRPQDATLVDVTLQVFLREPVAALGIAPFSSMHLFGEADPHRSGDARPEVHDSDGLALWSAQGERLFRPLRNPAHTAVTEYRLDSPRGFGLLQRDRDFDSYRDPAQRYQDRPSAWVEPVGAWGAGRLRLLEIATELESDDNIALLWVPDHVPAEGLTLRYRLHFGSAVEGVADFGKVVATRVSEASPQRAHFELDFRLPGPVRPQAPVSLELSAPGAQVLARNVQPNSDAGGFRASFELLRNDDTVSGSRASNRELPLRAFLRAGDDVLTETWSYPWQSKR